MMHEYLERNTFWKCPNKPASSEWLGISVLVCANSKNCFIEDFQELRRKT